VTRPQSSLIIAIFTLATIVRLLCLANQPYFVDAEGVVNALTDGSLRIQFPGYVPFCLLLKGMTVLTGSPFASEIVFSILCGLAAMIYMTLFAYDRGQFPGALVVSVVAGFSALTVFFSCVGTSYAAELAAASGMIFHGNRVLTNKEPSHFYGVLVWYVFGTLMRTASFSFTGLALVYLLWKRPSPRNTVAAGAALILTAVVYLGLSAIYFGSLQNFLAGSSIADTLTMHRPLTWLVLNWFRIALYAVWGLNLFLVLAAWILWKSRRQLNWDLASFFFLLTFPYMCLLLKYTPHAGYLCLVLPALICAPWVAEKRLWLESRPATVALVLAPILLAQIFLAHPTPIKGPVSLVANAYVLMYTRDAIKSSMNESLVSLAMKNDVGKNYIQLLRGEHYTNPNGRGY